ncbi:LysR family transcriptional regulator [Wenzhouxiangella sp. AB-CW3]|uniref:LysR family transcriptional regulator n=1 Tax=Wenzhouxiangella sp. AB-CW3 TaxID=2771012 RepID=UPI00168B9E41|nr:LysR family transcriptional regulator [Wenzhouxiangella sp. AB-CW3]QOC21977.1 LysR family transcriptional regulator [Wenzhouxiangella sp. AB-CW3]
MTGSPDFVRDMAVFARVVESNSFTAAAETVGLSKAAVSKTVRRLEEHFNLRLLNRTTRSMTVTLEGRALYDYCRDVVWQAEAAEGHLRAFLEKPGGSLRVTAPTTFGSVRIAPLISELLQCHPELHVDLVLTNRQLDLVADNIDIAVRCGALTDSSYIARRASSLPHVLTATPGYLERHGEPACPEDLCRHRCLVLTDIGGATYWRFERDDKAFTVKVHGPLASNHSAAIRHALLNGVGIANLPRYQVCDELEQGKLQSVLESFMPEPSSVHLVYQHRSHMSAAMKSTLDFLHERL